MIETDFSYIDYLAAKKSLDDRFLNKTVLNHLEAFLSDSNSEKPVHITEFGAGIGTMIERLSDWGLLNHCSYTCIEKEKSFIAHAMNRLHAFAKSRHFNMTEKIDSPGNNKLILQKENVTIEIHFVQADFFNLTASDFNEVKQDLIIAHTFLDIFHLPAALTQMFTLLRPDGAFYFTMNYDGLTHFLPHTVPEIDKKIEVLYNESMNVQTSQGKARGGSFSGRKLFSEIPNAGGQILGSGSSDWVLFPIDTTYTADEKYFIECLIKTAARTLLNDNSIPDQDVIDWAERKMKQLQSGKLIFQAHQLDFFGKKLAAEL